MEILTALGLAVPAGLNAYIPLLVAPVLVIVVLAAIAWALWALWRQRRVGRTPAT